MNRPILLDKLMTRGLLWRGAIDAGMDSGTDAGSHTGSVKERLLPTGIAGLDELLGGGWPRAALSEMLGGQVTGLSLWLPALADLSAGSRWLAWVNPPHLPYAPALAAHGIAPGRNLLIRRVTPAQSLWAGEQTLRSGHCAAVLLWPPRLSFAQLRRLQLAAEQGDCLGVLFRPQSVRDQASPAALRLAVEPEAGETGALRVRVLKRPGGWGGAAARVRVAPGRVSDIGPGTAS